MVEHLLLTYICNAVIVRSIYMCLSQKYLYYRKNFIYRHRNKNVNKNKVTKMGILSVLIYFCDFAYAQLINGLFRQMDIRLQ